MFARYLNIDVKDAQYQVNNNNIKDPRTNIDHTKVLNHLSRNWIYREARYLNVHQLIFNKKKSIKMKNLFVIFFFRLKFSIFAYNEFHNCLIYSKQYVVHSLQTGVRNRV